MLSNKYLCHRLTLFTTLVIILFISFPVITESQVIRGRVIEAATEKPVENVYIFLMPDAKKISMIRMSDSSGYFIFDNVTPREFYLKTDQLGYIDFMVGKLRMPDKDTLDVLVKMEAVPFLLKEVEVSASKPTYDYELDLVGFYRRKSFGWGKFYTREDFKNRSFNKITELLNSLPGIIAYNGQLVTVRGGMSGTSSVRIYLDGMPLTSPLDWISPYSIKAIEVFPRSYFAPIQYSRGGSGVILLWTGI
ncbi:MAG: TonB-dependent receptor plug domain-containing protein [Melioribacteraceae bacterium]|nr:TonB-dependent receptor plug domain-containing protein [Melioribacteraceae bacterium]